MVVGGEKRISLAILPCRRAKTIQQFLGFSLMKLKLSANRLGVAAVEAVLGELLFLRQPNFSVSFVCRPPKIVDARGVLDELANPFEPVSQLHGNRVKVNPAALLEIRELGNLQSIQQHLPANAPSPKCRRFPVVFLE